ARIAEAISTSAGLQASWNRREQDWNQQLTLARQELNQVEQQCLAADIRKQIAKTDLKIHRKQIEHTERLDDFYKNKFTNLGLYTYLSTKLNALYRDAYNIAYDMAKMAEKAYQFERDDDSSMLIAGDNWQYDRAGLLAGERLLLQLQHMEKAYLEKNTRRLEMTQSFSLALLDPNALIALRNTGECEEFWIPEIAYDLVYPGQYKRIIKSVRLSIPCVTGPHTNIGATLTLTKGEIRRETDLDKNLEEILHQKNTSIATSSSLNDSGVFELNFRDERYLPFEGAGAISTWNLTLPNEIRQFDYNTISDVVVHISYTALYDGGFKQAVESAIKTKVIEYSQNPGLFRVFSLSHEFPDAFHRLLTY
ncbi:toxin, partial [Desulfobulbus sp. US1]|nr:toxin [Desulfobulbus sp. US1]